MAPVSASATPESEYPLPRGGWPGHQQKQQTNGLIFVGATHARCAAAPHMPRGFQKDPRCNLTRKPSHDWTKIKKSRISRPHARDYPTGLPFRANFVLPRPRVPTDRLRWRSCGCGKRGTCLEGCFGHRTLPACEIVAFHALNASFRSASVSSPLT